MNIKEFITDKIFEEFYSDFKGSTDEPRVMKECQDFVDDVLMPEINNKFEEVYNQGLMISRADQTEMEGLLF